MEGRAGNQTTYTVTVYKNYTLTFMDENGVYKTLIGKHGEAVEMPEVPTKDGYTVAWETVIDIATGDATIEAVYTANSGGDARGTGFSSNRR